MVASHIPCTEDLAHHPDMCPDSELNQQPFGSQAGTQSTEPHEPGPIYAILYKELEQSWILLGVGPGTNPPWIPRDD